MEHKESLKELLRARAVAQLERVAKAQSDSPGQFSLHYEMDQLVKLASVVESLKVLGGITERS